MTTSGRGGLAPTGGLFAYLDHHAGSVGRHSSALAIATVGLFGAWKQRARIRRGRVARPLMEGESSKNVK